MSSLVYKQRQQWVVAAAAAVDANKTKEESAQQSQKDPQSPSPTIKRGLSRRSASFEKFLVTAFHIRLACAKCSRESLKLCLEMLILRSRIIAEHLMAALSLAKMVQLAHKWNTAVLEIANVVIPKWQIRVRHIVDTAILQRECRRQQEKRIETKATATQIKQDVIAEEPDTVSVEEKAEKAARMSPALISRVSIHESTAEEERTMRLRLTIAVAACVVFLGLQIFVGVTLLLVSGQGLPWGLLFQVGCVAFIAYVLQSICDFSRLNMTTCHYGKASPNSTMQRKVMHTATSVKTTTMSDGERETAVTVKLVQLSFIEKTLSKVKLL